MGNRAPFWAPHGAPYRTSPGAPEPPFWAPRGAPRRAPEPPFCAPLGAPCRAPWALCRAPWASFWSSIVFRIRGQVPLKPFFIIAIWVSIVEGFRAPWTFWIHYLCKYFFFKLFVKILLENLSTRSQQILAMSLVFFQYP